MTTKKMNAIVKYAMPALIAVIAALFVFLFVKASEIPGASALYPLLAVIAALVLIALVAYILLCRWARKKIHWYDEILDSLPWPLSITDMKRRWTFINKAVEGMLGVTRDNVIGKQCSSWGAGICGTTNCGINCLERGEGTTTFEQGGMDFKVDIAYLVDEKENKLGHIEVVQDISELVKKQKAEERLVHDIEAVSSSFIAGSKQIADGSQSLAQGSTEQAATTEQLAASVSEIADQTHANSEMAAKAAALAEAIKANAEKGSGQMNGMVAAVNDITVASESIGRVIKAIDDIAFQTNILALNAAVEAARAGQHGKGFAVVADEVRSLAAKSAEAAKDTGVLITNSIDKARLGGQIANETANSLLEIVNGINESSAVVSRIAQFSEEQTTGIDQVREAIDQIAQVVQVNSATTEESAAAAEVLNNHAISLGNLLDAFRRENAQ